MPQTKGKNSAEAKLQGIPPTHYRCVQVGEVDMFYREAGPEEAPVVLLLHGWPSSSRMFRNLIPLLADRYRVIAPDYPGFGHSSVPDRLTFQYTFDHLAASVESLLQKLGIEQFAMYIHDFGGPIGFRLMLKKPKRLTALISQNGPAFPDQGGWWDVLAKYWKSGSAEDRDKTRKYLSLETLKRQYLVGTKDASLIDPDNWLVDYTLGTRPGLDEIQLDMLYDIQHNAPVFKAAQQYFVDQKPPTLIVTGANDEIFPGEYMERYKQYLPDAEVHLIDSGHFALEDSLNEIAPLVHEFLDRNLLNT